DLSGGPASAQAQMGVALKPADDSKHDEQDDGAERRRQEVAARRAGNDAELGQDKAADARAEDADDDVADKAEAVAGDDTPGEPTGERADEQPAEEGHRCKFHDHSARRESPNRSRLVQCGVYPRHRRSTRRRQSLIVSTKTWKRLIKQQFSGLLFSR